MLFPGLVLYLPILTVLGVSAKPADVRYFAVWSYTENAPREEISAERLRERQMGYWSLEFDDEGGVVGATYHASDATIWLTIRYVEEKGRVYADLYTADGQLVTRKSTALPDRRPRWPNQN